MRSSDTPSPYSDLLDRIQRAIRCHCPDWLGGHEDDLVQAAMLRLLEADRKSRDGRDFAPAYLWRVAHSVVVDEIRRQRRRREEPLGAGDETTEAPASAPPTPETHLAAAELGKAIRDCLGAMVEARRQAVTPYLLGHTLTEIAELVEGELEGASKRIENRVYRGLQDLRKCLSSKGLEP